MTASIDDGLFLPRKLTHDENIELHNQLRPFIKTSAPDEAEFVNDLLDYAVAMVSNSKPIRYVIDNLIAMDMEFCTKETAEQIGRNIHEYLRSVIQNTDEKATGGAKKDGDTKAQGPKNRVAIVKPKDNVGNALTMAGALGSSREGKKSSKSIQDSSVTTNKGKSVTDGKDTATKKKDSIKTVDHGRKAKVVRDEEKPSNRSRDQRGRAFDRLASNHHRDLRTGESREATQERRNVPKGRGIDPGRGRGRDRREGNRSADGRGRSVNDRDDRVMNQQRDHEEFGNKDRMSHHRSGPPNRDNRSRGHGDRSFGRSDDNPRDIRGHRGGDVGNRSEGSRTSGNRRFREDHKRDDTTNPKDDSKNVSARLEGDREHSQRAGREHRPGRGRGSWAHQAPEMDGEFYAEAQEHPNKRARASDQYEGFEAVQDSHHQFYEPYGAGRHQFRGGFRGRAGGRPPYQGGRSYGYGGRISSTIDPSPQQSQNEMLTSEPAPQPNIDHHAKLHPSPIVAATSGYNPSYYRGGHYPFAAGRGRGRGRNVYFEQPDVKSILATKTWVRSKDESSGDNAVNGNTAGDGNS